MKIFTYSIKISFCLAMAILGNTELKGQTSGPTAPEYTSFEPVDVTDMVNLATGDFTYSLPIIEVPGPEGGYPLSLSYHAGIQPNEEASWVGLGWTLNAGAITRTVNGYADDQLAGLRVVRDYDSGGERHTYSVGVGLPGVNFGMQFSNDTNLGFGIGSSMGLSLPIVGGSTSAIRGGPNFTVGVSPHGGAYQSVGFGFSVGKSGEDAKGLAANVGVSTNFESVSFSGGIGYRENANEKAGTSGSSQSLLGASLSSNGSGSASAVGVSISQANNNAGNWTVNSWGFTIPIPLGKGLFLNLGYNYMRYFLDETDYVQVFGVLNARGADGVDLGKFSFDSYALLDTDIDFIENSDPDREIGGSFPSYDSYAVNAQGLSGNIQPYLFQNMSLFRQNVNGVVDFDPRRNYNGMVEFRFVDDFANALTLRDDWRYNSTSNTFENTNNQTDNYGFKDNHLAGSKHVDWYTNLEIRNGIAHADGLISQGFFGNHPIYFDSTEVADQIGGFKIISEDGITYHFSKPVYNYEEYFRAQDKENPQDRYHERKEEQPYAYQWLLTAITGPDFVDRGEPGLDGKDWGYWVGFSYEQHVTNHRWRNPTTGYRDDIDGETELYSRGMKELYYLNSIFTRTHVALFHKSDRLDGREVSSLESGGFEEKITDYENFHQAKQYCRIFAFWSFGALYNQCMQGQLIPDTTYFPRPFRKLDKITLHRVEDLVVSGYTPEKSLRAINFEYDYSLQPGVPNSYDTLNPTEKSGKLSLRQVTFKGKKEKRVIPPVSFDYDLPEEWHQVRFFPDNTLIDVNNQLYPGDLVTFNSGNESYFAVILNEEADRHEFSFVGENSMLFPVDGTLRTVRKTKNPPYRRDAYDSWGLYKSDFTEEAFALNQNLARYTSDISSAGRDVWSLRSINSSLGSRINVSYTSDRYRTALAAQNIFRIKDAYIANNQFIVEFFDEGYPLSRYLAAGSNYDLAVSGSYYMYRNRVIGSVPSKDVDLVKEAVGVCGISSLFGRQNFFLEQLEILNIDDAQQTVHFRINSSVDQLQQDVFVYNWPEFNGDNFCDPDVQGIDQVRFSIVDRWPDYITGGTLYYSTELPHYGGSLKVSSIQVASGNGSYISSTNYNYLQGWSSYEPWDVLDPLVNPTYPSPNPVATKEALRKYVAASYSDLLAISREVPSPGVVYGQVTITEEVNGQAVPGKMVYEFETFDSTMVQRISPFIEVNGNQDLRYPMTIRDYSVRMGNLKSVSTLGKNDVLLAKTGYNYLHDYYPDEQLFRQVLQEKFNNQGVIAEAFNEFKTVTEKDGAVISKVSLSKKERYPNILIGQETVDTKTGISTTSWTLAFDRFSGAATKTLNVDSYGNHYLNETTPAYTIDTYKPMMELALYDGKNMLTQSAASFSYLTESPIDSFPFLTTDPVRSGLIAASVQTWATDIPVVTDSNIVIIQGNIPRKKSSYTWDGAEQLLANGTYPIADFDANTFDYTSGAINPSWEKRSEVTLVDVFSNPLEASDVNSDYAATIMNPRRDLVTATATPARYDEITFTSAEFYDGNNLLDNGVDRRNGAPSTARAHTGDYSLLVAPGFEGFTYTLDGSKADLSKSYRASVWVYLPGDAETVSEMQLVELYAEAGAQRIATATPIFQQDKSKSWYLLQMDVTPPAGVQSVRIACKNDAVRAIYLDDFRVHPLNAALLSYVYDPFSREVTYILDKDNLYTRYEYDDDGRLVRVSREFFYPVDRTVSESILNYGLNHRD